MSTRVLAVIGARLGSSRLPGKHLLDLAGRPMINHIFDRLQRVSSIDQIVLATTSEAINKPLLEWARREGKCSFAYSGDPDDVTGRVDAVVARYSPEILLYVCGDSPLVEPSTISRMIHALLDHPEADHVELELPKDGRLPIHEGFNPWRISTWRRLVESARTGSEREHVGSALPRLRNQLSILRIPDNPVFFRLQHRISVDTPSDYRFQSEVYRRWYSVHPSHSIVSLPWLIGQLESDPELRRINKGVRQKQVKGPALEAWIVTQCGTGIGLGHFSRALSQVRALQDFCSAGVRLLIQGDPHPHPDLKLVPHEWIRPNEDLACALLARIQHEMKTPGKGSRREGRKLSRCVVFDLAPKAVPQRMEPALEELKRTGVICVAIDGMLELAESLDLVFIPSFFLDSRFQDWVDSGKVTYGWDHYLLPPVHSAGEWRPGNRVIVMTGAEDIAGLGRIWPSLFEKLLPGRTRIHWIQGPYAPQPQMPRTSRLLWTCHRSPTDLSRLMDSAHYGLIQYGVSLFEMLKRGKPCVTWAHRFELGDELKGLSRENVAIATKTPQQAVEALARLMRSPQEAGRLALQAGTRLEGDGAVKLANSISRLTGGAQ